MEIREINKHGTINLHGGGFRFSSISAVTHHSPEIYSGNLDGISDCTNLFTIICQVSKYSLVQPLFQCFHNQFIVIVIIGLYFNEIKIMILP